jgi:hypothetical protein
MKSQFKESTERAAQLKAAEYASEQDFCKIFNTDMQSLYVLALVLTANHTEAEQAFVAALNDCLGATGTFKPWAASRSRLAVIQRAIKNMEPALTGSKNAIRQGEALPVGLSSDVATILRLDAFHRFVFVLTVLEKYSVRDCAILLRRRVPEIEATRLRAMAIVAGHERQIHPPAISLLATPLSA